MKQRIISAVVAIAVFVPIVVYGGLPTILLAYAMASIAFYEILKMQKQSILSGPGLLGLLMLWILLLPNQSNLLDGTGIHKLEWLFIIVLLFLSYTVAVKNKFTFDHAGSAIMGAMYIGIGFHYFIETREAGLVYLLFALFIVWATDSGAYFIGKAVGKRKLWPEISPNKTVEGSLGGIIAGLAVAVLFIFFADMEAGAGKLLLVAVLLSIFGQIGDLAESALKRHYGVKDSGNIMPGHGGILDRCDSWLFVLPLTYLLLIH